jgi:hypothetical protein
MAQKQIEVKEVKKRRERRGEDWKKKKRKKRKCTIQKKMYLKSVRFLLDV